MDTHETTMQNPNIVISLARPPASGALIMVDPVLFESLCVVHSPASGFLTYWNRPLIGDVNACCETCSSHC